MLYPLVAIVGAPNVGKSTLFNRLVGRRRAIVTAEPGVTRDRLYGVVRDAPRPFRLVDTGGLTPHAEAPLARDIERQAEVALAEAAVVLFLVDARAGATALDQELAVRLRRSCPRLLLVANKVDSAKQEPLVHDLHELGLGDALPVSAEHGSGIEALIHAVDRSLEPEASTESASEAAESVVRVAIVGRPNVGKSSILNWLVGEERVLVSEVPGTTRDSIDTLLQIGDRRYRLVDTAGIRRRGKARVAVEVFAVQRARRSIEHADVAILVLDAAAGFAAQDAHIAGLVMDAMKPMVVAVNKWDLIPRREEAAQQWEEEVRGRLKFVKQVPMVLVSARTGQRVLKLLDHVDRLYHAAGQRVRTSELNRWLEQVARTEGTAPAAGRSIRLLYATQTGVHPPRFVLFCNDARRVHFSVRRFLRNSLRERFGFDAAPIDLRFRSRRVGSGG